MAEPLRVRREADAAVEELYAAHWRPLVRFAVLLVRDQAVAEDVVQDAFVALHQRWGRLSDRSRATAYLRRSVVNGSRSVLRHRSVVDRHLQRAAGAARTRGTDLHTTPDATAASLRRTAVLDALAELPRRQREVLVLRHYLDLGEAEIAATLGITRGSVKTHASRGAAALRARLPESVLEER